VGLFKRKRKRAGTPGRPPSGAPGARAYAIGDVHGRLDLLRALLDQIAADRRANPCEHDYIVFLGDLIDRGPDSAGVVDYLCRAQHVLPRPVFLMGNHEEMLLRVLDEDSSQFRDWLQFGGYEFAQSYGVEVGRLAMLETFAAAELVRRAVPNEHIAFLDGFVDSFRFGDYLFVHAGIRPGVPIENQSVHDLRWIREDFLDSTADHGMIVVHGHTITPAPEEKHNRIGIDTGAYRTGILTALCIQDTERTYLTAR
jgi:serine/threonine protein phosphatase 1